MVRIVIPSAHFEDGHLLSPLLAASAHKRCTSLVCSCYVPSISFTGDGNHSSRSNSSAKKLSPAQKKDGVMAEVHDNELQGKDKICNAGNVRSSGTNRPHLELAGHKSNLKKADPCVQAGVDQQKMERRKVNWPDAHGADIAHVHEFEPSVSEEGELEGVRNSCVCAIQ